jgi:hypothetical protein
MWRIISSWRDESDDEFVVWHVLVSSDDGHTQTVDVKVDAQVVAMIESPTGGGAPSEVRVAIATRGKSLVGRYFEREDLPASFVYRRGSAEFVME